MMQELIYDERPRGPNPKEVVRLYQQHKAEMGWKDRKWRFYALPLLISVSVALLFLLGDHIAYSIEYKVGVLARPYWLAAAIFVGFLLINAGMAYHAYIGLCHRALKGAGIEVPESESPSMRELWRNRRTLRSVGPKRRITRLFPVLPFVVPTLFVIFAYSAPGATLPENPVAYQIFAIIIVYSLAGGYTLFLSEWMYLSRIWKRLHFSARRKEDPFLKSP